ncbi:MAG TPA: type II and III secretion system protein family protein [Sphingobium sp.]|nr:type II and III secretion system protein family protein [Sphingobium sp.]
MTLLPNFGRAPRGLALASALLLATGSATAPFASAIAAGEAQQENGALLLSVGESRVVNLNANLSDVVIANPEVLDVHVRSQRQVYLIAKAPGETNVFITTGNGQMLYANAVRVGNNLTSMDQMLQLAMPEADIRVATMNGMLLLTGTVSAPEDAAEAERLVQAFAGEDTTVVSRLKTATPLQVNLQVRIAEVNKSFVKSLGFNLLTSRNNGSGFLFGLGQGNPGTITYPNVIDPNTGRALVDPNTGRALYDTVYSFNNREGATTLGAAGRLLGMDVMATLDLAETQGLASTLANPNLTALSGETASFLAGGEIPIPIVQGGSAGAVSIEYKQYGVSLAFTPTVLADGRISMRVRPEVSQLDDSAAVKMGGFTIPGVSTRRAETTVELGSGQSFMIGGLLSTASGNSVSKAPFLGDLPILGNLFKSQQWRRQETELVIIVTPYLVRPVDAHQIALPTDGYRNADDGQRLVLNQMHAGRGDAERPKPTQAPPATVTPDQLGTTRSKGGKAAAAPGFSF